MVGCHDFLVLILPPFVCRSCPECRTQSDFVVPSRYWVDNKDKEEKKKLLDSYQTALRLELKCCI